MGIAKIYGKSSQVTKRGFINLTPSSSNNHRSGCFQMSPPLSNFDVLEAQERRWWLHSSANKVISPQFRLKDSAQSPPSGMWNKAFHWCSQLGVSGVQTRVPQDFYCIMTTPRHTLLFNASEGVQLLSHPPYSPDLAPCDFFLFPHVKKQIRGAQTTQLVESSRGLLRVSTKTCGLTSSDNGLIWCQNAFWLRGDISRNWHEKFVDEEPPS